MCVLYVIANLYILVSSLAIAYPQFLESNDVASLSTFFKE